MQSKSVVVVLGTGGTIAGTSAAPGDDGAYSAAQLGIEQLVGAVPALQHVPLECEQVAQLDSKDMSVEVWRALAGRVSQHLARLDVHGIVITHGTDTLEETAYLLHRLLAPSKPVVLTGAMRPATSRESDGPRNLLDAVHVASHPGARGVLVVLAGAIHAGAEVHKAHTHRLDAFDSGDDGPLGRVQDGRVQIQRAWPSGDALGADLLAAAQWPRVEIVCSHAGADGRIVDGLLAQGTDGLVVAATGSGTVHAALEAALLRAQAQGVPVLRSMGVRAGRVAVRDDDRLPSAGALAPAQARVELLLRLLARR